jgi:tetratricopeptide (TPR) repeat protein
VNRIARVGLASVAVLALAGGSARASEPPGDAPGVPPRLPGLKKREAGAVPPPTATLAVADPREPRAGWHPPIAMEAARLDRLLDEMPADSPKRPGLLRAVGDEFAELAAAKIEPGLIKDVPAFRANARRSAIRAYSELRKRYPDRVDDRVTYALALQYERTGDLRQARALYYDVIQKWPTSKLVPRAYLAFGDMFAAEAPLDVTKWKLAQTAYVEVLKYPAPANDVAGYARYRLAHAYWSIGDLKTAMQELAKVIRHVVQYGEGEGPAKALGKLARDGLVAIYALIGDPKRAQDFFRDLNGVANNRRTLAMMYALGDTYVETGHYGEGIDVFSELVKGERGSFQCLLQFRVAHTTLVLPSAGRERSVGELERLLAIRNETMRSQEGKPKDRASCSSLTGMLLVVEAIRLHAESLGGGGRPGTNDRDTMTAAADLYGKVLATYSAEEIDELDFGEGDESTRPTAARLRELRAGLERRLARK